MNSQLWIYSANYPWCQRCNKFVEAFSIETPMSVVGAPPKFHEHTGEIIVTVECHGEHYVESNWRGRL